MQHEPHVSLADVLPSCAAALGVPGFEDVLGIGACDHAVVLLVDGLGACAMEHNQELFPILGAGRGGSIEAAFPTTTATGLASLGTGLNSGRHGLVGASFYLPETDHMLSPLHWGARPSALMVQPEPTVFERVRTSGVTSTAIGPAAYAGSGLTKAVLRGSDYVHAETLEDRVAAVGAATAGTAGLTYVYWPALDRAGHEFGVGSGQWHQAACEVNRLVEALVDSLPPASRLVVTADHGMVDITEQIWLEHMPSLTWGLLRVGGEPRMRHLYCEPDQSAEVRRRWGDELGEKVRIWSRQESVDAGLFGPVDEALLERIGDLVVLCEPGIAVASSVIDPGLSQLPGQHGALSDEERRIPGLIFAS